LSRGGPLLFLMQVTRDQELENWSFSEGSQFAVSRELGSGYPGGTCDRTAPVLLLPVPLFCCRLATCFHGIIRCGNQGLADEEHRQGVWVSEYCPLLVEHVQQRAEGQGGAHRMVCDAPGFEQKQKDNSSCGICSSLIAALAIYCLI